MLLCNLSERTRPRIRLERLVKRRVDDMVRVVRHHLHGSAKHDFEDVLPCIAHIEEDIDLIFVRPATGRDDNDRKLTQRLQFEVGNRRIVP